MAEAITDELFARAIVDAKVATFEQVLAARHTQALSLKAGIILPLPEALINDGVITTAQRDQLLKSLKSSGLRQLGKYKLIKQLGRGAMGVVFLAEDTLAGRRVALKVLPKKLAENQDFIGRFKREAKATGKLNHVNIIGAFDAGEDQGHHYYVMEYCEGKPLSQILNQSTFLPWEKAVDVVVQVALGLQHAHENNVLHRDIKPENIFVTNDGTAKILDLGLSKDTGSDEASFRTQSGNTVGTPHYISPEQARGDKPVDGRADIYSLGATFYHLLTGQYPFNGPTAASVMLKHLTDPMPNPQLIQPGVPDSVVAILERMAEKDPADRYSNCDELIADLTAVMCGKQPSAAATAPAKSKSAVRSVGASGSRVKTPAMQHSIRRPTPERLMARSAPGQHLMGLAVVGGLIVVGCVLVAMWSSSNATVADNSKTKTRTDASTAIATGTATDLTHSSFVIPALPVATATATDLSVRALSAPPQQQPGVTPATPFPPRTDPAADAQEKRAQDAYDALDKRLGTLASIEQKVEALDAFNKDYADTLAGARSRALKAKLLAPPAPITSAPPGNETTKVSASGLSRETVDTINGLVKQGLALSEKHEFPAALAAFDQAIKLDATQPILFHNRSSTYFEMGDCEKALADNDKAIALGANNWRVWAVRAILSYGMHREDEYHSNVEKAATGASVSTKEIEQRVIRDSRRARMMYDGKMLETKVPQTAADFLARGNARVAKENLVDGLADLKEALKLDPTYGPQGLFNDLANLSHRNKSYREAIAYYKQWCDMKPEDPIALNGYAWELLTVDDTSLRDPKLALQFAERASTLTKNENSMILDTLALAYFNNGRISTALTTEEKALSLLPSSAPPEARKDYEDRIRQFRNAMPR